MTQAADRRRGWHLACAALSLACAPAGAAPPPTPGRYAAQFCVATLNAEPGCGPVEIEWRAAGRARLRISDIVYALRLYPIQHTGQIDVVLKHGAMQIDGFTANYEWDGPTPRFVDAEKSVRYEVRPEGRFKGLAHAPPEGRPAARR